ncbi:MmcQ/YjbR family DNA-binding protein [Catellatospora citrea]|uniref:MmcQ/YjbR family DNA-binding protein n=1 Tax=Catellatospora citrea TaxID=53366 RepID=UPI0033EDEF56
MVTVEQVRQVALSLPRAYEVLVRDRVKFRVGRIVFAAFSADETELGFGYPKEARDALVAAEPDKFFLPRASDLRYHWVQARMAALDSDEMRELIIDAWRMCVPKRVAAEHLRVLGSS